MHSRRPIVHAPRATSLGDREATGARRKGTPGAAPRLRAACGGPAAPLSTRARSPRRVRLPGTSCTMRRERCGAGARVVCQPRCCAHLMGRSDKSPPPSRSRASRAAGRARNEGLTREKLDRRFRGQTAPRLDRPPRAAQKAAPRRERPPQPLHSKHQVSLKRAHAEAAAQPHP